MQIHIRIAFLWQFCEMLDYNLKYAIKLVYVILWTWTKFLAFPQLSLFVCVRLGLSGSLMYACRPVDQKREKNDMCWPTDTHTHTHTQRVLSDV